METMKNKLKDILQNLIPDFNNNDLSLIFIKGQALLFLFCILLYLVMTVFDWVRLGYPDKQEFRNFLVVLGGFSTIITMYGKWLVDKDKDGIPDVAEKETNTEVKNNTWRQKNLLK